MARWVMKSLMRSESVGDCGDGRDVGGPVCCIRGCLEVLWRW